TIIDGDSSGSVIKIDSSYTGNAVSYLIKNFTLTNGSGTQTNDQNEPIRGGAIYAATLNNNDMVNLDSLIIQNSTAYIGAGFYYHSCSGKITNTIIRNNSTPFEAAAGMINHGYPYFKNVTITNNTLNDGGNLLRFDSTPSGDTTVVNNTTFINNNLGSDGYALNIGWGSNVKIINSSFDEGQINIDGTDNSCVGTILYSNVPGGNDSIYSPGDLSNFTWGTGNIDVDPMFVDTANGNYHLLASSQLINAGHPDSTDSDGTVTDIGAYPYLNSYSGPTWYISESGNDTTATGTSTDPFRSIQAGINFSSDNDSITVAAGTYTENIIIDNKTIDIAGVDPNSTIINGNNTGSVIALHGSPNASKISGFTITGGTGIYTSDGEGGGIYIGLVSGGPVIDNCIVTGNSEGAFFFKGESTIMNTLIHGNDKSFTHYTTTTLLKNCTFVNQSAGSYLGDNVNLTYLNCIVMDENISSSGGSPSILNVSYSLFENGTNAFTLNPNDNLTWGPGNLDVVPMFMDTTNGDYTLQMDSPLIDAGHPDSTDADGTRADIGAYYYDQSGQPARVLGFVTTPTDSSEIILTWDALSPEPDHYAIYRHTDKNADFYSLNPHISSVAGNAITIIDDNQVTEDITYYYRIRGIAAEGDEGLLALLKHGRLGLDSTSLYMQSAYLTHTTGTGLDAGSSYTLEAFVRFPEFPTDPFYFLMFGNHSLQLVPLENDQARIDLHLSGTDYEGIVIADTSWHHVALTTNGSTTTLWVDGYAAINATAVFTVNNRMLQFGNSSASTSLSIRIDDARLSNSVRYSSGFIPVAGFSVDANTLGYWAFDEGSTDEQTPATYDRSGNGLHLSIEHEGSDVVAWYAGVPVVDISSSPLVINEIMQNPSEVSDPQGEWIEIYNTYFTPLYLKDYVLSDDGSDDHTIASAVVVPAGGYAVLASNADTATNASLIANYEFSGFSLGNSNDEVLLSDPNGVEIDRVAYDNGTTFPDPSGASMELIAPHYDNSLGNSWTVAVTEYGAGDLGSPGRRNDAFSGAIVLSDSVFSFGGAVEGNE
ncbi:uncharacterized protein METZ01_LOCUS110568, partial [marine metagenome]